MVGFRSAKALRVTGRLRRLYRVFPMRRSRRGGGSGPRIRQLRRRFVRGGRRHEAHRRPALHSPPHHGDHGVAPQGGRCRPGGAGAFEYLKRQLHTASITTPSRLPEAIAGRTYADCAGGDRGPWTPAMVERRTDSRVADTRRRTGQMTGTPPKPTDEPIALAIEVSDGTDVVEPAAPPDGLACAVTRSSRHMVAAAPQPRRSGHLA